MDAKRGDTYALGGATITILSPDESDDWENINDWSVVMMVQYGRAKYLLMGDAETPVESYLLENNADLSADVLKMGHHGSNTSSKKTFLNAVHPTLALITCDQTRKGRASPMPSRRSFGGIGHSLSAHGSLRRDFRLYRRRGYRRDDRCEDAA